MRYVPHTEMDIIRMLESMGITSISRLFDDIPESLTETASISDLGDPLSEWRLSSNIEELSRSNTNCDELVCFRGAGVYDHWVPAAVKAITSRAEFLTSYTPYQPEISQGLLQAIYEYQTMICRLLKMDVANASMYDGATALAESLLLACSATGRSDILLSPNINKEYLDVALTYGKFCGFNVKVVSGCALNDSISVMSSINDETAAVVIQTPNFWGYIEDPHSVFEVAHRKGSLAVAITDPICLGILKPPGEYGADIAIGDGQTLANQMSFGGSLLGIMAVTNQLMRKMPGRIVGRTKDSQGREGFVLTLQTREQHIRRAKATSNICSNQALNALAATVYLSLVGSNGLKALGSRVQRSTGYARRLFNGLDGYRFIGESLVFREFIIQSDLDPTEIESGLIKEGILGGLPITSEYAKYQADLPPHTSLWCITEKRTREEIDRAANCLGNLPRRCFA